MRKSTTSVECKCPASDFIWMVKKEHLRARTLVVPPVEGLPLSHSFFFIFCSYMHDSLISYTDNNIMIVTP